MDRLNELRALQAYQTLSPAGRNILTHVLTNPPARAVGRRSLVSSSGTNTSSKFSYINEYESSTCERAYIFLAAYDDAVLDIFHQPIQLNYVALDRRGRKRPVRRTVDFLEVTEGRFTLVECKKRDELETLAAASASWTNGPDGWRYHPGEEVAAALGMSFRVFCPDDYSTVLLANLEIATRFPRSAEPPSVKLLHRIRKMLSTGPQTIRQLCGAYAGLTGAVVWAAINNATLFGRIDRQLFDLDFLVHADKPWDPAPCGAGTSVAPGPMRARLDGASATELASAITARAVYEKRRDDNCPYNSTDFRYKRALARALHEGALPIAAFVPRFRTRGSRKPRIAQETIDAIAAHGRAYLSEGGLPVGARQYADFEVYAAEHGLHCPSAETYRKYSLRMLAPERAAFMSGGKRAFHALRPRTDPAMARPRLLIAGLRVHLDGVLGDVRARADEEGVLMRPIYYPMVDDATGFVLGRGVMVGRANSGAVAMAFRDCYMRRGVLPASIVADWGSEFINKHVEEMCRFFGVAAERRPVAAPRFGAMGEMMHAPFSRFLQSMAGGTFHDRAGRAADGDKKSRSTARYSVAELVRAADKWLFETWNRTPIGSNRETPEELWLASRQCFPEAFLPVEDGPLSRYYTSRPIGEPKCDYVRGLKHANQYYTSKCLPDLIRMKGEPVKPRLDCLDPSVIRVLSKEGCIELHSSKYWRLQGASDAEHIAAMEEQEFARPIALANQQARARKDARLLRDMLHLAPAVLDDVSPVERQPVPAGNFSGFSESDWGDTDDLGPELPKLDNGMGGGACS